ncbi:hypothetical protein [Flagellimonas allohymeniacidonis]|uniref:Uncharacterized protein n=1 Tax=Flagellimonas allohymeniacidonis TaxID=2517819 RepID=A0A4Q8QK35_9FLAO|nr:hypothetical protein [Allomuricauda hymeniacidonis]TAI48596.1 hypothetical protein EW142_01985 [Allomuricauda hymeniacidonis]
MKIPLTLSHNFFHKFFEQNKVPPFYEHVSGLPDSVYNSGNLSEYQKSRINCIYNVPPYIFGDGDLVNPHFGYYSRSYQLGYAMDLTEFKSATAYLRNTLKKKRIKLFGKIYKSWKETTI